MASMMDTFAGLLLTILPLASVIGLWIGSLYDQRFANVVYKLHLLRGGVRHLLFSTDRKWKKQPDADGIRESVEATKEIIFIRHGESQWNEVFNKGFGLDWPGRLFGALFREAKLGSTLDSVFVDSPLSEEGCAQARDLQSFVESSEEGLGAVVKGIEGDSVLCSSNLRRALSTATIGMWERIQRTQEKIHILSSLQEVTFNIDGVALAKPQGFPELAKEEVHAINLEKEDFAPERYYNAVENDGDKPVDSRGIHRIKEFASWCFDRDEATVIAAGHSLYFRYFFDTFLPRSSTHLARKQKMQNCAIVAFTLEKGKLSNGKSWFRINEDTIRSVYLDFETKKVKKSKKD